MKLKIFLLLVINFFFLAPAFSDNMLKGFEAYNNKDYISAYNAWLPLAESGDAIAQSNLGIMFKNGEGVSQNYEKSFRWFSLSAKQGYVFAQTLLGYMYENGYGVIQSDVDAYMWFYIAASKNDPDGIILLGLIQKNMSEKEINKAKEQASQCMMSDFINC